ncbi:MAG: glutamate-cysteine ligase family protein [Candidatus Asgardarchaeia archaeon]
MRRVKSIEEIHKFPYTQGIEVELAITKRDGSWIYERDFIEKFKEIIRNAGSLIKKKVKEAPPYISEKVKDFRFVVLEKKGFTFRIKYKLGEKANWYDVISRDPNISRTFILEIATPPCEYLEELSWWLFTILNAVNSSIKTKSPYLLIACGLNPTQKYSVGLSFGEHHHIGCKDRNLRIAIYNMIRNFIPHLIALSVNSPFEEGRTTDDRIFMRGNKLVAPRCVRSIRLMRNDHQLGPSSPLYYVPYLREYDKESFVRVVGREKEGGRLVDIYPFTKYETIEIRVFDTQFSIMRQISIACIIEALALKATKIYKREGIQGIPEVRSEVLTRNREEAIRLGLKGVFYPDDGLSDKWPEFHMVYNRKIFEGKDEENRYLNDAVKGLLFYVREELMEMGVADSIYMYPLYVSIFGSENIQGMTSPADMQLIRYVELNKDIEALLLELNKITERCSENMYFDPMGGVPEIPPFLAPERAISLLLKVPGTVVYNQRFRAEFYIRNTSPHEFYNVPFEYFIIDARGRVLFRRLKVLPKIPGNSQIKVDEGFVRVPDGFREFNLMGQVKIGDKIVKASVPIRPVSVGCRINTEVYGIELDTPIDFFAEVDNEGESGREFKVRISVVREGSDEVISRVEKSFFLSARGKLTLTSNDFDPLVLTEKESFKGTEKCYLLIEVLDENGNVLSASRSDPMIILYTSPEVKFSGLGKDRRILTPIKEFYTPGDELFIHFKIVPKGHFYSNTFKLVVEFITENSGSVKIFEKDTAVRSTNMSKKWKIPEELMMISEKDNFRIALSAYLGKKKVGYLETEKFELRRREIEAIITSIDFPKEVVVGDSIRGTVGVETFEFKGRVFLSVYCSQDGENEEILGPIELQKNSNVIIEVGPHSISFYPTEKKDYVTLMVKIYDENGKDVDLSLYRVRVLPPRGLEDILDVKKPEVLRISELNEVKLIKKRELSDVLLNYKFMDEKDVCFQEGSIEFSKKVVVVKVTPPINIKPLSNVKMVLKAFYKDLDLGEYRVNFKAVEPKREPIRIGVDVFTLEGDKVLNFVSKIDEFRIKVHLRSLISLEEPIKVNVKVEENDELKHEEFFKIKLSKNLKMDFPTVEWKVKSSGEVVKIKVSVDIFYMDKKVEWLGAKKIFFLFS